MATTARPNRQDTIDIPGLIRAVEDEIDPILNISKALGNKKTIISITGTLFAKFSVVSFALVNGYERAGWKVKDITGNRVHTAILEFTNPHVPE
jgi:hypothetical protein